MTTSELIRKTGIWVESAKEVLSPFFDIEYPFHCAQSCEYILKRYNIWKVVKMRFRDRVLIILTPALGTHRRQCFWYISTSISSGSILGLSNAMANQAGVSSGPDCQSTGGQYFTARLFTMHLHILF